MSGRSACRCLSKSAVMEAAEDGRKSSIDEMLENGEPPRTRTWNPLIKSGCDALDVGGLLPGTSVATHTER
jgi:hypothetical protein